MKGILLKTIDVLSRLTDKTNNIKTKINLNFLSNTECNLVNNKLNLLLNLCFPPPPYLTFTAKEANSTVKLTAIGLPNVSGIQYKRSTDTLWQPYTINTLIALQAVNDSVQFRNTSTTLSISTSDYVQFAMTGKIEASGNTNSMLNFLKDADGNEVGLSDYCYYSMFYSCTALTTAPELPATTLADYCYSYMFYECINLTTAPELPATTLASYCYRTMFSGCTRLTSAPELPATTLVDTCYRSMFSGCTGLTSAPKLPATTLARICYTGMFKGCTGLTSAPELPATTLALDCYSSMFNGCTGLTSAPKLPAITLTDYCYSNMFNGCTSLTTAPELPATTLAGNCYSFMFQGCTGLTSAPELPATTLANYCYRNMFYECTSLTSAPELPATTLASRCYWGMFQGCTKLNYIKVGFTEWNPSYATDNWVNSVSSTGTFICPEELDQTQRGVSYIPEGWTISKIITPLTFTAEEAGSTINLTKTGSPTVDGIQYRLGTSGEWLPYTCGTTLTLENIGEKVQFQNTKETLSRSYNDYVQFLMTGKIAATGNIQSMLNYSESCSDYCYDNMFSGCTSLTSAPKLPATTLADWCYYGMFLGCTGLTSAPELPATTLASRCYESMFRNCTGLTSAPELPATTLADYCYNMMFFYCAKLNYIKVGFTEWNPSNATNNWVCEVASSGTFECPEELDQTQRSVSHIPTGWNIIINPLTFTAQESWATLSYSSDAYYRRSTKDDWSEYTANTVITLTNVGDYVQFYNTVNSFEDKFTITGGKVAASGRVDSMRIGIESPRYVTMFSGCTSLIEAPELPATKLTTSCYSNMFNGCTSLTTAPMLPATELAGGCYMYMFKGCTELTTAPELPATTVGYQSYMGMFYNCTSLTTAPELPATTLDRLCYNYMFKGCTGLTSAPELPATTLADYCYDNMFKECTGLTSAPALPATTLATGCYLYMFYECTGLTSAPELPATTLATGCYSDMFRNCTGLTSAPELPATTLANYCYDGMFNGCTSLTTAPELPATTLALKCYRSMFNYCTKLTTAPELPATTLADQCYEGMFSSCTKLNYIKVGFTEWNPSYATESWLSRVASSGTFICPEELDQTQRGSSYIPEDWTIETY